MASSIWICGGIPGSYCLTAPVLAIKQSSHSFHGLTYSRKNPLFIPARTTSSRWFFVCLGQKWSRIIRSRSSCRLSSSLCHESGTATARKMSYSFPGGITRLYYTSEIAGIQDKNMLDGLWRWGGPAARAFRLGWRQSFVRPTQ